MSEPRITVNGQELTEAQAMIMRVALEALATDLEAGLGDDDHGRVMTEGYRRSIREIRTLILGPKSLAEEHRDERRRQIVALLARCAHKEVEELTSEEYSAILMAAGCRTDALTGKTVNPVSIAKIDGKFQVFEMIGRGATWPWSTLR